MQLPIMMAMEAASLAQAVPAARFGLLGIGWGSAEEDAALALPLWLPLRKPPPFAWYALLSAEMSFHRDDIFC